MLDMQTREYSEELFDIFGLSDIRHKFPDVRPCRENYCEMISSLARELGLDKGVLVASGPMDVSACALGAGAVKCGQAVSILGTSAIHEVVMDRPCPDPKLVGMTLCHATGDTWLRMLAAMNATPNIEWAIKNLCSGLVTECASGGNNIYELLDSRLEAIPPGADGVIFHPYLYPGGERAPFVDPNVKGSFWGLSSLTSSEEMVKAVYEGVGFAMKDCYTTIPELPQIIYLTGGGAKSGMWAQLLADINQAYIKIPEAEEPGALGAAINAMVACGEFTDAAEGAEALCRVARTFEPSEEKAREYEEIFQIYRMLTDVNRKIYKYASERRMS